MPRNYSRATIKLRPRRRDPGVLKKANLKGVALHWPAMSKKITTVEQAKTALRSYQNFHMDERVWSDIAYNVAFDQQGNRYKLRGRTKMSAANGNTTLNKAYTAILLLLVEGEEPSAAMLKAVRTEITKIRKRNAKAKAIVGHREIRPGGTECPGRVVQKAIDADKFEPRKAA